MDETQIVKAILAVMLAAIVIVANVTAHRRRSKLTPEERARDDADDEADLRFW